MSSKEDKSWNSKFKEALNMKTIALVLLIMWTAGEKVWDWIETGANVEFQNKIIEAYKTPAVKAVVKAEFKNNITDPAILGDILASPSVEDFSKEAGEKIEAQIVSNVLKEDSTKVSMISGLGQKVGIRDEDVMTKMSELLDAWNKGELVIKEQIDVP